MRSRITLLQGVLYKPENFVPEKKYPLIIHYYEIDPRILMYFPPLSLWQGYNIPWFVSRGYLVFTPDIKYKMGDASQSICNSIIASLKKLKTKSFIDTTRIAINGHSFGGYETNVLVTNLKIFAAAVTASGPVELISEYGGNR